MEKRLNVTMGEAGARVDISGTPLDIVFMMGIVILDIHKSTGIELEHIGELLNRVVTDMVKENALKDHGQVPN